MGLYEGYKGRDWGYIGIIWGLFWGYIGIMENKMETTGRPLLLHPWGLRFRV